MLCFGSSSHQASSSSSQTLQRKIVVLGDGACGKSSLLSVFTKGYFPSGYEPTVFENYVQTTRVGGQLVELSLWDTAGQEEFDRLRSLSYADTHVIMCCFSADSPVSLDNVESKWIEEIHELCPGVRVVLVALKCDLRDDPHLKYSPVSYEDGLEVAKRIGASRYLECSAKRNRGVIEAFDATAQVAVAAKARDGRPSGPSHAAGRGKKRKSAGGCLLM